MKKLNNWLKSIFGGNPVNPSTTTTEIKEDTKVTNRIKQLREGIQHLNYTYDTNLQGLQDTYNSKLVLYNKQYQQFEEVFRKYRNKAVSDAELAEEKKLLQEKESELQDAGALIQEVAGYKAEDIQAHTGEMEALAEEFTTDIADSIINKASHLQELKQQYLSTLSEIQALYSDVVEAEKVLNNNNQFKSKMTDTLGLKTEKAPLNIEALSLKDDVIINHLKTH
ncbi:hypothetical protein [Oceanobacillus rekensis]|uniref:hypothetical protein n=1 Tax=Oceanobacillus rekensis TaxID=937927 RepID=UPI000B44CB25|nr:hypothetical protein [Oceanobacillus rekensis]